MLKIIKTYILQSWPDILVAILLGTILSCASYQASKLIPVIIFTQDHGDIWFETDTPRVYNVMSTRESDHGRDNVHPLFSLMAYPLVYVTKNILHVEPVVAVRLVVSLISFIWAFILFILLRVMGCLRLDSFLFTLLGMFSAASMFYFTVPETYSFASVTILLALTFAILTQQRKYSNSWYIFINIITLSITTTNWMAGIIVTFVNRHIKDTIQIMINAFFAVTLFWGVQKIIFPTSSFFLDISGEKNFVFRSQSGGPFHVMGSFFYHTLIMPAIRIVEENGRSDWPGMYTQLSSPGSGTEWGGVAVVLWSILLLLGAWSLFTLKNNLKLRLVLGITLLCQLGLHLIYGTEILVYSLHFIALLIPLVALSSFTKARPIVLSLTFLLIICVALNNFAQFNKALDFFKHYEGIQNA